MAAGSALARQTGLPAAPQPYKPPASSPKPTPPASYPKPDAFVPQPRSAAEAPPAPSAAPAVSTVGTDWNAVKAQFQTAPDEVNMSAMLIATHPLPVRKAIDQFRRELDWRPVTYLDDNNRRLQGYSRAAAGRYLGVPGDQVALTDSTTMGAALVYGGLRLGYGDEILTTNQDYYVTHESLRRAALRTGFGHSAHRPVRQHRDGVGSPDGQPADRRHHAQDPRPGPDLGAFQHRTEASPCRRSRPPWPRSTPRAGEPQQILLAVDGVHGFGNQDADLAGLGCDIFMAGCHKWLFGPRGTGIIAANARAGRPCVPWCPASSTAPPGAPGRPTAPSPTTPMAR